MSENHQSVEGMTIGEASANRLELEFAAAAIHKRGAKVWRSGWPDFLVYLPELGHVAVEVKSPNDQIRPNQAKMFAALESAGLKVYIWEPTFADKLIPWRKHDARRAQMASERRVAALAPLIAQLDAARTVKDKQRAANRLAWAAGRHQRKRSRDQ